LVRTMDRVGAGGGGVRRLARADAHE
jgi:hypothetical protein